ncbi:MULTISPECIES: 5' nucleotidase, NT5C type [Bacillus]|uniref:5' nucleotidase, NT5C type n=1 Tax=Bacillus TaxID=1386 RepID=UPI001FB38DBB|nr:MULTISPECIES: HAD family acid phosphatase [Bacillus]MEC2921439.1 HAD family acid phosphatase [Bacillus tropicus]MEC2926532.1 HAD family acid phosphatase [Bacillus tropicus]MEC2956125.1 HAD family acid phosphatase [Bacillus tropicus]MEC3051574.1 HAD family acid phosphatase [Bacillus tropicus]MEC3078009.1 HAD family acid phosphatase [Bacillus tropicus]
MKFGFDIDDTLIDLRQHAFHLYNKKLNKEVELDVFHSLKTIEIHEAFGMTSDEGGQMWNSLLDEIYYTSCSPFPYAVETLQELVRQGHEVYYITARPKEHGEQTKKWLREKGFPVQEECFFFGMKDEEKIHFIKEIKLDYFFDDKPAVLETLIGKPIKVYAKNTSYNQHLNIPYITSWTELGDIIKKDMYVSK